MGISYCDSEQFAADFFLEEDIFGAEEGLRVIEKVSQNV